MNLSKNYKIESDNLNVTIWKRCIVQKDTKTSKKGDEYWTAVGYYATVQGALSGIVKMEINGTGLKDFRTVVTKVNQLEKLIRDLCSEKA